MSVLRRQMFQKGAQQVMGEINQGIDNSQNFEQMINATRGDEAPIEDRYRELASIVGPEDAMQTPESVLTLAQPVIENALVDEGIGGLAQEQMSEVVTPEMTGGIMEMTQPVQQFQTGGAALSDYYQQNLPLIQEVLGSEDVKRQAQGQALLDIAQRAFLFGSGINPATGKPYGADETEAQKLAGLLASATTPIGEQLAAVSKVKQAEKAKALDMAIAQKTAADAAKAKTVKLGKDEKLIGPNNEVIATGFRSEKEITLGNGDVYNITNPKEPFLVIKGSPKEENITLDGQIINVTNPKAPFVVFGEKRKDIVPVEGALIDTSGPEAKVFYKADPKIRFENVNGVILNVTDPNDIKIAYSDPNKNIQIVNGVLIDYSDKNNVKELYRKEPDWKYKMDTFIEQGIPKKDAAIIAITNNLESLNKSEQRAGLVEAGVPENTADMIVNGYPSDLLLMDEKVKRFTALGYDEEKATLMAAFGITDNMKTQDIIDRLMTDGDKTLTEATQIALGGLPDKRYFQNDGQIFEIIDGKLTQTFGEENPDIRNVGDALIDVSNPEQPKVLYTKKFNQIREVQGVVYRFTENEDGSITTEKLMGEKDQKLITIGRTVLNVTNPKQVQIAWQDEESDIRIINNTAVKFNKDGSYEVIREDPTEEIKLVDGQLVQLVKKDGVITPTVLFGKPKSDGENWYIRSTSQFVISYDAGNTYRTAEGATLAMPADGIKVSPLTAFDAQRTTNLIADAKKERNRLFPNNAFNADEFYSVRVPPPTVDTSGIAGGTTSFVDGQEIELDSVDITGNQVNNILKVAMEPYADAKAAALRGTSPAASAFVAFDRFILAPFGAPPIAAEQAKAQQVLRSIIVLGRAAFVNNPRFPVYEMVQARELFPDPDVFFQQPEVAYNKLISLKRLAITRLNQNLVDIESGNFSADDMTVKQTQNIEIKNLLYLLQTIPYGTSTTEIKNNPLRS
jgi:hypothetical protein